MIMKRLVQVAVGAFALIGIAYSALIVYAHWFLPHCVLTSSAQAHSPDGQHFAIFEQRVCEEAIRSRSEVKMGAKGREDQIVLFEIQGTTDVRLTWNGDRELIVTLPEPAAIKRYGPYDEWPRVVERRVQN
jgi:hypothetical protein